MTAWDEWTIPVADLGPVNPAKLDSITVGVSGKVYVDAIRVNRPACGTARYAAGGAVLDSVNYLFY